MKQDPRFPNLFILNHPLIQHKLSHMREHDTSTRTFRELLREITLLMGYEITRDLPLTTRQITTPLVTIDAPVIAGKKLAVVPILRAGIGMSDGLLELVPSARVGHIGVFRDPDTHEPVEYLVRLPDVTDRTFILCDPMVATGNSAGFRCSNSASCLFSSSYCSFCSSFSEPAPRSMPTRSGSDAMSALPCFDTALRPVSHGECLSRSCRRATRACRD